MIYFNCDYNEGAHLRVLEALARTNLEQTEGYGTDPYCERAREVIRQKCGAPSADVHFLVGGTQANLTVIGAALRPHQGVLAARTAHINVHETGAVEAVGHKVLALPGKAGKLAASQVEEYYKAHVSDEAFEHMVQPGMVYLSHPTELGTLYTLEELEEMAKVCRSCGLFLYIDGARLGYGLAAAGNDVSMSDLARLCDAFYIGGTKEGALFGEALVITNPLLKKDFRYILKQKGGMLAKGRLLGVQFLALLEGDLYLEISRHADELAERLREAFRQKGFPFLVESHTNQVFPILPDAALEQLGKKYVYSYQERMDSSHSAVRFCTSWATEPEAVEELCREIGALPPSVVA